MASLLITRKAGRQTTQRDNSSSAGNELSYEDYMKLCPIYWIPLLLLYLAQKCRIKSYCNTLPTAHVLPVNPSRQLQVKLVRPPEHVPPFSHALSLHTSELIAK